MPTPYKTARFEAGAIPDGLRKEHRLKPGVHGELRVLEGTLVFVDARGRRPMAAGDVQPIAPDTPHHLEEADDAAIELTFSR
jgi:tellurite resistance-related uncharacterized protein